MKTVKFTIIRQATYKINDIYSNGCREGPSKDKILTKITKFAKTAKFTRIRHTCYNINEMYSDSSRADPSKVTRIAKFFEFYENCEIYDNSQDH